MENVSLAPVCTHSSPDLLLLLQPRQLLWILLCNPSCSIP